MSTEMYTYIEKSVTRMAARNIRKNAKTKFRESYKLGIVYNIVSRIYDMGKQCSWAPDRENQINAITQHVRQLRIIKDAKTITSKPNSNALQKGYVIGANINLNRQTTGSGGRYIE